MANRNIQKSQQVSKNENTLIAQTMKIERHSILPPPAELKEYEKLYPGTTELLLKEFQAQAHHRMEIEKQVITSGVKEFKTWTGVCFYNCPYNNTRWLYNVIFQQGHLRNNSNHRRNCNTCWRFHLWRHQQEKERIEKDRKNP